MVEHIAFLEQKLMVLVVQIQLGVPHHPQFVTEQVLLKPVIVEIQEQQREQALQLVVQVVRCQSHLNLVGVVPVVAVAREFIAILQQVRGNVDREVLELSSVVE